MTRGSIIGRLTALALAAAALAAVPEATAHGDGGGPLGYSSAVTGIEPEVDGLSLEILDADDRLLLVNESGKTVVVLGYDGELYLRVTPEAAYENVRSAATYLNADRYADVDLPEIVDATAEPEWRRVADEPRVEWHDHRIHWMSTVPPPVVQEDPGSAHRILDWEVPLEVDGSLVVASGALDYAPPDEGGFSAILLVPPVLLVLAGGAFWWLHRRAGGGDDAATGAPVGARPAPGHDGVR